MARVNFNKVFIIGNLTKDPDYKQQASGMAVCRLSIASNREMKNKQTGMVVSETCYIDVDVWGNQAENCKQYLAKGKPVLIEGRLKHNRWESDGQTKQNHTIVADRVMFLGQNSAQNESDALFKKDEQPFAIEDDNLPF